MPKRLGSTRKGTSQKLSLGSPATGLSSQATHPKYFHKERRIVQAGESEGTAGLQLVAFKFVGQNGRGPSMASIT
jgi:citrate lyase synthetase